MSEGFLDCFKRERGITVKPALSDEKYNSIQVVPRLKTHFSRNLRRNQLQAHRHQEIHDFNTSAGIINKNSNFMTL